MHERPPETGTNHQLLRQIPKQSKADVVIDHVPDFRPWHAMPNLFCEFVPVMKPLERSLLLDVGEVMIPLKFGDQRDPPCSKGQRRQQTH